MRVQYCRMQVFTSAPRIRIDSARCNACITHAPLEPALVRHACAVKPRVKTSGWSHQATSLSFQRWRPQLASPHTACLTGMVESSQRRWVNSYALHGQPCNFSYGIQQQSVSELHGSWDNGSRSRVDLTRPQYANKHLLQSVSQYVSRVSAPLPELHPLPGATEADVRVWAVQDAMVERLPKVSKGCVWTVQWQTSITRHIFCAQACSVLLLQHSVPQCKT